MGWTSSDDNLSYPLQDGVQATFFHIAEDVARTVRQLTYPGSTAAHLAALEQLSWLEKRLRKILNANELALYVAISANHLTKSITKDCANHATPS